MSTLPRPANWYGERFFTAHCMSEVDFVAAKFVGMDTAKAAEILYPKLMRAMENFRRSQELNSGGLRLYWGDFKITVTEGTDPNFPIFPNAGLTVVFEGQLYETLPLDWVKDDGGIALRVGRVLEHQNGKR